MLNIGIVGLGNIGNNHAGCYMKNEDVKLVAVCDIIKEKADAAAKKYDAKAFYSVQGVGGIGNRMALCRLSNQDFFVGAKGHDRRSSTIAFGIFDDFGFTTLHHRHTGIRGTEVYANNSAHLDAPKTVQVKLTPDVRLFLLFSSRFGDFFCGLLSHYHHCRAYQPVI